MENDYKSLGMEEYAKPSQRILDKLFINESQYYEMYMISRDVAVFTGESLYSISAVLGSKLMNGENYADVIGFANGILLEYQKKERMENEMELLDIIKQLAATTKSPIEYYTDYFQGMLSVNGDYSATLNLAKRMLEASTKGIRWGLPGPEAFQMAEIAKSAKTPAYRGLANAITSSVLSEGVDIQLPKTVEVAFDETKESDYSAVTMINANGYPVNVSRFVKDIKTTILPSGKTVEIRARVEAQEDRGTYLSGNIRCYMLSPTVEEDRKWGVGMMVTCATCDMTHKFREEELGAVCRCGVIIWSGLEVDRSQSYKYRYVLCVDSSSEWEDISAQGWDGKGMYVFPGSLNGQLSYEYTYFSCLMTDKVRYDYMTNFKNQGYRAISPEFINGYKARELTNPRFVLVSNYHILCNDTWGYANLEIGPAIYAPVFFTEEEYMNMGNGEIETREELGLVTVEEKGGAQRTNALSTIKVGDVSTAASEMSVSNSPIKWEEIRKEALRIANRERQMSDIQKRQDYPLENKPIQAMGNGILSGAYPNWNKGIPRNDSMFVDPKAVEEATKKLAAMKQALTGMSTNSNPFSSQEYAYDKLRESAARLRKNVAETESSDGEDILSNGPISP